LEIADEGGKGTGKYRLTAKSDEDGSGPFGNSEHAPASIISGVISISFTGAPADFESASMPTGESDNTEILLSQVYSCQYSSEIDAIGSCAIFAELLLPPAPEDYREKKGRDLTAQIAKNCPPW
jgi:hypothetical protein